MRKFLEHWPAIVAVVCALVCIILNSLDRPHPPAPSSYITVASGTISTAPDYSVFIGVGAAAQGQYDFCVGPGACGGTKQDCVVDIREPAVPPQLSQYEDNTLDRQMEIASFSNALDQASYLVSEQDRHCGKNKARTKTMKRLFYELAILENHSI